MNDVRILHESGIADRFQFLTLAMDGTYEYSRWGIITDCGYRGAGSWWPTAIVKKTKPPRGELMEIDVELNKKLDTDRSVVEQFNGKLKEICALLGFVSTPFEALAVVHHARGGLDESSDGAAGSR
jgi:hypothetical protein